METSVRSSLTILRSCKSTRCVKSVFRDSIRYRLHLPTPHSVDPNASSAKWHSDTSTLEITLKLTRELDNINFWLRIDASSLWIAYRSNSWCFSTYFIVSNIFRIDNISLLSDHNDGFNELDIDIFLAMCIEIKINRNIAK